MSYIAFLSFLTRIIQFALTSTRKAMNTYTHVSSFLAYLEAKVTQLTNNIETQKLLK